jgi:hypothetical protein
LFSLVITPILPPTLSADIFYRGKCFKIKRRLQGIIPAGAFAANAFISFPTSDIILAYKIKKCNIKTKKIQKYFITFTLQKQMTRTFCKLLSGGQTTKSRLMPNEKPLKAFNNSLYQ